MLGTFSPWWIIIYTIPDLTSQEYVIDPKTGLGALTHEFVVKIGSIQVTVDE
jgi:hypothetical protein